MKVEEQKFEVLKSQLESFGLYRLNYRLISFHTSEPTDYIVKTKDIQEGYFILVDTKRNERTVHFSLLQNYQTKYCIEELKQTEKDFNNLEITDVLKSIKYNCEKIFHPENSSNLRNDVHRTLLRLKVLILEKLEQDEISLSSLTESQLTDLQEEIKFSISIVDPSNLKCTGFSCL